MNTTFLVLINNAPLMGLYHIAVGEFLEKRGNKVIYAFTDYNAIYRYSIELKDKKFYVFSDFFEDNYNFSPNIPEEYESLDIWKMFHPDYDRNVVHYKSVTYDKVYANKLMINLIYFFDTVFKENKVDCILNEVIANSFSYVCYEVATINKIDYCGYAACRLPGRFELYTEEFGMLERFKNKFDTIVYNQIAEDERLRVKTYLNKYRDKIPSYHPKNHPLSVHASVTKKYFNIQKLNLIQKQIQLFYQKRKSFKYFYMTGNPLLYSLRQVKMQIKRKVRIVRGYNFDKPQLDEKYYLYPLHFKPESSTSVLGQNFCSDIDFIKNISFALPFGTYLYVKEHFVNFGAKGFSFYEELKKLPNVKIISYESNAHELIKNSIGVITISGTMGFEALFIPKRVLAFGNVFFQYHPNCTKVNSFEDVPSTLKMMLNKAPIHSEEIDIKFIVAYLECTYEGNIYYNTYNSFDPDTFVDAYIQAIEKYRNGK